MPVTLLSFRKKEIFTVLAHSPTPLTLHQIALAVRSWPRNYIPPSAYRHLNAMVVYYIKVGYVECVVTFESPGVSLRRYTLTPYGQLHFQHAHCDNKV